MKKILLLLFLLLPLNVFADVPDVVSKSVMVVNRENSEVLYEKNINEELPVASLTKIMTVIVSLENIVDVDELVTITKDDINVTNDYVKVGLKEGMEISYKDLLYSTMLNSAADSALTLANHVSGSYDVFIEKMNILARKLGMNNTHFSNPIGFDENNYSTASDMIKLLDYCLENQNFYEIYTSLKYDMQYIDKTINNYVNLSIQKNNINNNQILFDGSKTGFTTISGLSLSGITNIHDNELMIVTIGAMGNQDTKLHLIDSTSILSYFKEFYSNRVLVQDNVLIDDIIYKKGKREITYEIRTTSSMKHFMDNRLDLNYLKIYYEGDKVLDKNTFDGKEIGKIKVFYEDQFLDEQVVMFDKKHIVRQEVNYLKIVIICFILVVLLFILRKKK